MKKFMTAMAKRNYIILMPIRIAIGVMVDLRTLTAFLAQAFRWLRKSSLFVGSPPDGSVRLNRTGMLGTPFVYSSLMSIRFFWMLGKPTATIFSSLRAFTKNFSLFLYAFFAERIMTIWTVFREMKFSQRLETSTAIEIGRAHV